jgi:hypothetical protein
VRTIRAICLASVLVLASSAVLAATYPELADRSSRRPVGPYGNGNGNSALPTYGAATAYPAYGNTAMYMLPASGNGLPDSRQVRWSYGQVNAASDPFFIWGLRTQGMYVPWSTPMSGWTNAQNWNWWRGRAGDSGPPPPLW